MPNVAAVNRLVSQLASIVKEFKAAGYSGETEGEEMDYSEEDMDYGEDYGDKMDYDKGMDYGEDYGNRKMDYGGNMRRKPKKGGATRGRIADLIAP